MPQGHATYAFSGGLDTNSAALAVPPGCVISSMNYEPLAEGYGRVEGFERYDGQTAPSAASFWLLGFDNGGQAIADGDTVTGATSGATGVVVGNPIGVTGDWDLDTAAGTLLLAAVSGTFQDNELLNVSASPCALVNGTISQDSAGTEALRVQYLEAVQAYHRTLIAKVPGEGSVLGVAVHNGTVYAWRNNVGSTKAVLHRATAAGWVECPAVRKMAFTAGSVEINEGDTITGGTSGATAVVVRVVVASGDWGTANAAGTLFLKSVTGAFIAETLSVGATPVATGAATTAADFPAGGRYRTISHNFYGSSDRYRLYGANGVGQGFELVDHAPAFVATGMATDTPTRVFEIANHLGFTFPGGSLQFSGTGEPFDWAVVTGAGEIGLGTEITDVVQANETAVAIFGAQKIAVLTGADAASFSLDTLTEEAGADADSAQRIARTVYVDKRGLRSLDATQAYGNFKAGALSGRFERYFRTKRLAGATIVGSYLSRTKSQYRLVWDDGTGLTVYMGGKQPEAMATGFDDMRPYCFGAGELSDGEGMFVGAEDGYVYRLDSGTSFDGSRIRAFVMTPFNHFGNPRLEERYHSLHLELECPADATLGVVAQFDYGDGQQPVSGETDFITAIGTGESSFLVEGGGGAWDSAIWNEFHWSAPIEGIADCPIDGVGVNASFIIATYAGLTEASHTLQAYTVYRSPRKMRRGR